MKKILSPVLFSALIVSAISCGDSGKQSAEAQKDSMLTNTVTESQKEIVLYNVPSPIETFTILKMSGPGFDKSLTNPATNISKYVSNYSKAVNLGVYSTDLSFCFLYAQNQEFNNYLKNINELTTALGIDGSYGQDVTKRLQANSNNLDSLMTIATEASVNADLYLKENQRNSTTILIAAGNWVEALYIISGIAVKKKNEAITSLVADQKIAVKNIIKMMEQLPDDKEIAALLVDIKDINTVYEGLQPVQAATPAQGNVLKSIGNNTSLQLTDEQLKSINDKVTALRNKLIN